MISNRQTRVRVNLGRLRDFLEQVQAALRISREEINVCILNDAAMRRLNREFRGKPEATDVLSFPWQGGGGSGASRLPRVERVEFRNFLGDLAISIETAARNARREGHSLEREIRWLTLHGTLHLLGYDHEADRGEMAALELRLRDQLGIGGNGSSAGRRRNARRVWAE